VTIRDRSGVASSTLRKLEVLPPMELDAAVLHVAQTGLGASPEEVAAAAPRLLGFKSVSSQLRQLVLEAIARLEGHGLLVRETGLLMAVETKDA